MPGRLVTFEGIDGSGKSTQLRMLADSLRASGRHVVETREPGGSDGAEEIRQLVLNGEAGKWSAETEILLFTAARRDHVERTISPAIAAGSDVLCDRFIDSTRVYQTVARPELRATVDTLHFASIGLEPNLTLVLDIEPEKTLARLAQRQAPQDRFEERGLAFQRGLRAGFLALAAEFSDRCYVIDACGTVDEIADRVWKAAGI